MIAGWLRIHRDRLVRGGEAHIDRGPRVEMAVPAAAFNLVECADLDEAVEVSAKHPTARFGVIEIGVIEIRPFADG